MADESKYDIVAATGCPTGIAHTFMAKEALEKAAAAKGLTIKVETHGQVGVENELTAAEIRNAKAVVVAADKDVQAERFAGKPMVNVVLLQLLRMQRVLSTALLLLSLRASLQRQTTLQSQALLRRSL